MCLTITAISNSKQLIQTAQEDIFVCKIINKDNTSIHFGFQYSPNTLYRLRKALKLEQGRGNYIVNEGFHAYQTIPKDNPLEYPHNLNLHKFVKFTIPKGAKYYVGDNFDIVSTSIRSGDLKSF